MLESIWGTEVDRKWKISKVSTFYNSIVLYKVACPYVFSEQSKSTDGFVYGFDG